MRFESKKDLWLGIGIWAAIGIIMIPFFSADSYMARIVYLSLALILAWFWFGTFYVIKDGVLRVYTGPVRFRIKISTINKVSRTRNPLSSAALSLDRLEIMWGSYGLAYVSPADRDGFIKALLQHNSSIHVVN